MTLQELIAKSSDIINIHRDTAYGVEVNELNQLLKEKRVEDSIVGYKTTFSDPEKVVMEARPGVGKIVSAIYRTTSMPNQYVYPADNIEEAYKVNLRGQDCLGGVNLGPPKEPEDPIVYLTPACDKVKAKIKELQLLRQWEGYSKPVGSNVE